jgi:hypothetical protein
MANDLIRDAKQVNGKLDKILNDDAKSAFYDWVNKRPTK